MERYVKKYPVPPVCSAYWTEEDWERTAVVVDTEPDTIGSMLCETHHYVKTGERNALGEMLYRLEVKRG